MAQTTVGGLSWNPKASDPFQIETPLAQGMMDTAKSGVATALLAGYSGLRDQATRSYSDELDQQKLFARQQLAAQIANNQRDDFTKLIELSDKNPWTLPFAAGNPTYAGLNIGSSNPSAYAAFVNAADQAGQARRFEQYGKGAQGMANAGIDVPPNYYNTALPNMNATQGTPVLVRAAEVNAQSRRDAAAIAAANKPKLRVNITPEMPGGASGGSFSLPVNSFEEGYDAILKANETARRINNGGLPLINQQPVPGQPVITGPPQQSSQPAKPSTGPGVAANPANVKPIEAINLAVTRMATTHGKAAADDVNANRQQNGLPVFGQDAQGNVIAVGKTGRYNLGPKSNFGIK